MPILNNMFSKYMPHLLPKKETPVAPKAPVKIGIPEMRNTPPAQPSPKVDTRMGMPSAQPSLKVDNQMGMPTQQKPPVMTTMPFKPNPISFESPIKHLLSRINQQPVKPQPNMNLLARIQALRGISSRGGF